MNKRGTSQLVGIVVAVIILALGSLAYFTIVQRTNKPIPNREVALPVEEVQREVREVPKERVPQEGNKSQIPDEAKSADQKAEALKKAVHNHFSKFEAKDVPSLMADYTRDGTYAEWGGRSDPHLEGNTLGRGT